MEADLAMAKEETLSERERAELLFAALAKKGAAATRKALAAGADPDAKNLTGCSAVERAVRRENEAALRELIKAGADVNARSSRGGALAVAVENEQTGCLRALIEAGANLDALGERHTAIGAAVSIGALEALEELIKAGADVNIARPPEDAPLAIACKSGEAGCARALIAAGARINPPLKEHQSSAAMIAARNGLEECLSLLIEAGVDLNQASGDG